MEKSQANMSDEREPAYSFLVCWWEKKKCVGVGYSQERGTCLEI